jgi:hypothetical protein
VASTAAAVCSAGHALSMVHAAHFNSHILHYSGLHYVDTAIHKDCSFITASAGLPHVQVAAEGIVSLMRHLVGHLLSHPPVGDIVSPPNKQRGSKAAAAAGGRASGGQEVPEHLLVCAVLSVAVHQQRVATLQITNATGAHAPEGSHTTEQ